MYSTWKAPRLSKIRRKKHMYALTMKNVVALIGSATTSSANHKLLEYIRSEARDTFQGNVLRPAENIAAFRSGAISGTYTVRNYGDAQSYPGCGWSYNQYPGVRVQHTLGVKERHRMVRGHYSFFRKALRNHYRFHKRD